MDLLAKFRPEHAQQRIHRPELPRRGGKDQHQFARAADPRDDIAQSAARARRVKGRNAVGMHPLVDDAQCPRAQVVVQKTSVHRQHIMGSPLEHAQVGRARPAVGGHGELALVAIFPWPGRRLRRINAGVLLFADALDLLRDNLPLHLQRQLVGHMLRPAAAAAPVERTERLHALGRGAEDFLDLPMQHAAAPAHDVNVDPLARNRLGDKDHLAVLRAPHALHFRANAGDFQNHPFPSVTETALLRAA